MIPPEEKLRAEWTASKQPKTEKGKREQQERQRHDLQEHPYQMLQIAVGKDVIEGPGTDSSAFGHRKKNKEAWV